MNTKKILEIVKQGRDLIAKGWTRGTERRFVRDQYGSDRLQAVCGIGALGVAAGMYENPCHETRSNWYEACGQVATSAGLGTAHDQTKEGWGVSAIPHWNDSQSLEFGQAKVLAAFDKTVSRLEELCAVESAALTVAAASQSLGTPPVLSPTSVSDVGGSSDIGATCVAPKTELS